MKEIRRRTKVAEPFPHEESALLLITARLKRLHERWAERRYLDLSPLWEQEQAGRIRRRPPDPNTTTPTPERFYTQGIALPAIGSRPVWMHSARSDVMLWPSFFLPAVLVVSPLASLTSDHAAPPRLAITEQWTTHGSPEGIEFGAISGMDEAADGRIWISDGINRTVVSLGAQGTQLRIIAESSEGPGGVAGPSLLARVGQQAMAVYDVARSTIELFSVAGRHLERVSLSHQVWNAKAFVCPRPGHFLLSGGIPGNPAAIHQFGQDGRLIRSWYPIPRTREPRAAVYLAGGALTLTHDGELVFSQAAPHRILKYRPGEQQGHMILDYSPGYRRCHADRHFCVFPLHLLGEAPNRLRRRRDRHLGRSGE